MSDGPNFRSQDAAVSEHGAVAVTLAPMAARVGHDLLAAGGNAIDAAVAAALTAAVVEPASCGIAGYGAHITIALADGRVTCIDANTTAPKAAAADMFQVDARGRVRDESNYYGWLSAGVPGTLAGLQLALERHGNKSLGEVLAPAIRFARDGFEVPETVAVHTAIASKELEADPVSKRIYFPHENRLTIGDTCRNVELADLLETLAERGSVETFYRGDIAQHIASEFQRNGGLVTAEDFALYEAREVQPVAISWGDDSIHTVPLTGGGSSTMQALLTLRALRWERFESPGKRYHAALEALRLAWRDRFLYFGDPEHVEVPTERLLSDDYAEQLAREVDESVKAGVPIDFDLDTFEQAGTVNVSAGDAQGNVVALTLTHGGAYGARVTVEGTGLTLGHGISRFDPRPGYANSIGPGKRPVNNMMPTVVLRRGRPVLAIGGRGGRLIPNALFSALLPFVVEGESMERSLGAPRLHTEGALSVRLDDEWSDEDAVLFKGIGYEVERGRVAYLSAVFSCGEAGQQRTWAASR